MDKKVNESFFFKIKNIDDICKSLDISQKQLKYILYKRKNNYKSFKVNKKNGSYRIIKAPYEDLKYIQRKLLELLYEMYDFKECQHGFVKNKSIVTNANMHIKAKHVLNIDLENFFDTINFGRVRGLFLAEPFFFNNEVATILAQIVCDDNKLPQGAPTSPAIANMICHILDNNLSKYCSKYGCIYTRYADDITISSTAYKFPKQICQKKDSNTIVLGSKITKIIEKEAGFIINPSKIRFSPKMQRQEVTGLVINEKVNVKRIYTKNLRALLHNCKKNGILIEAKKYFPKITDDNFALFKFKEVIRGKLNFLKMVRGNSDYLFLKYAKEYNDLFEEDFFDVDSIKEIRDYIEERIGVIQSDDELSQGTLQFVQGYGAITSTHVYINKDVMAEEQYLEARNGNYPFPIKFEDISIFRYSTKNDRKEKTVPFPKIKKENVDLDTMNINLKQDKYFNYNLNKDELKIGKKVIIAGYSDFIDFNRTGVVIQNAEIISEKEIHGIKAKCINKSIYHGMSGGPVLNENKEVIGIIYFGTNGKNELNNAFIPLSEDINILENF